MTTHPERSPGNVPRGASYPQDYPLAWAGERPERLDVSEQVILCTACDLHERGNGPIPFFGPSPALVAVVCDAPSEEEDARGRLGVGPEGTALREMLAAAGFDPKGLFYANAVSCYPAGDLARSHLGACRANLAAQLELSQARWVILFGAAALSVLRPDLQVRRTRGHALVTADRTYLVTLHPEVRSGAGRSALAQDLELFRRIVEEDRWTLAEASCVVCGTDDEDMGDHGVELHFDQMGAAYCGDCWHLAPENQRAAKQEAKEVRRIDRVQTKTGHLFG